MKLFVFSALLVLAAARPQDSLDSLEPEVKVLSERFEQDEQGSYQYGYELDNGQKVDEQGTVVPGPEPETGSLEVQGSYSFLGDDGVTYTVTYTAGEQGFQAQGDHLPQAPAQIPEYAELREKYPQLFWAENQQPAEAAPEDVLF
ncbi:flexible cuticle protein 12-like [Amphibalanus amphitrite]|uniref:flexible cuticle protein 12-like n=1 Tax=Amphibalanus amphitrite TaxID=1232801 RepID=UPI001C903E1C|nr:flexible cuticle protein 12-like [Amphibalanus amphitrite]